MSGRTLFLAAAGFVLLSLVYTYPLVRDPARANRFDSPDAMFTAWTLSWDLHQLGNDPRHLFDANIFYPEKATLAYSENLLAGALMVAPLGLFTDNPILLLNIALLAALATSGLAAFVLAHHMTGSNLGAALAGVIFAFAPYRWAHIPHLQLQLAFALPLSFYFARRLREGASVNRVPAIPNESSRGDATVTGIVGLGLSVAAAFGSSGYYAIFLLTALPFVVITELMSAEVTVRFRTMRRLAMAGLIGAAASAPLALPYAGKLQTGTARAFETAEQYSAGWTEYVSSFSKLHFFLPKAEEPLFPGFVAIALVLVALVASFRKRTALRDEWMLAGVGLLGIVLSLGPSGGLFSLLFRFFPPYQGLRVPSRAGILFLFAVAVLAAYGLARIRQKRLRMALFVVVAAECYAGPLPWSFEVPTIPPIYQHLADSAESGAVVELPLPHPNHFQDNARYVYRSIFHWRPLVNGYSGFVPPSYREAFRVLMRRDLSEGLRTMSSKGVRFVLVHSNRLGPRMKRQIGLAETGGLLEKVAQAEGDVLFQLHDLGSFGAKPFLLDGYGFGLGFAVRHTTGQAPFPGSVGGF